MKPPKNVRRITPKVCGTCASFYHEGNGYSYCNRINGPGFDTGDGDYWLMTCDRWRKGEEDENN